MLTKLPASSWGRGTAQSTDYHTTKHHWSPPLWGCWQSCQHQHRAWELHFTKSTHNNTNSFNLHSFIFFLYRNIHELCLFVFLFPLAAHVSDALETSIRSSFSDACQRRCALQIEICTKPYFISLSSNRLTFKFKLSLLKFSRISPLFYPKSINSLLHSLLNV